MGNWTDILLVSYVLAGRLIDFTAARIQRKAQERQHQTDQQRLYAQKGEIELLAQIAEENLPNYKKRPMAVYDLYGFTQEEWRGLNDKQRGKLTDHDWQVKPAADGTSVVVAFPDAKPQSFGEYLEGASK